jgi:anti-sigma factor RsiW
MALLDGELSAQDSEKWTRHLAVCPECRSRQEALMEAAALAAELRVSGLPLSRLHTIRETLRQAAAEPSEASRSDQVQQVLARCLGNAIAAQGATPSFPFVCEILLGKRTAPALVRFATPAGNLDIGPFGTHESRLGD